MHDADIIYALIRSYSGSPPLPPPGARDLEDEDRERLGDELDDFGESDSSPGNPVDLENKREGDHEREVSKIWPLNAQTQPQETLIPRAKQTEEKSESADDESAREREDDEESVRQDWHVWEELFERTRDE
eukprot:2683223-Rhodomonas_salina.1